MKHPLSISATLPLLREQFREENCKDCLGYDGRAMPLWNRWGNISHNHRTILTVSRVK